MKSMSNQTVRECRKCGSKNIVYNEYCSACLDAFIEIAQEQVRQLLYCEMQLEANKQAYESRKKLFELTKAFQQKNI